MWWVECTLELFGPGSVAMSVWEGCNIIFYYLSRFLSLYLLLLLSLSFSHSLSLVFVLAFPLSL